MAQGEGQGGGERRTFVLGSAGLSPVKTALSPVLLIALRFFERGWVCSDAARGTGVDVESCGSARKGQGSAQWGRIGKKRSKSEINVNILLLFIPIPPARSNGRAGRAGSVPGLSSFLGLSSLLSLSDLSDFSFVSFFFVGEASPEEARELLDMTRLEGVRTPLPSLLLASPHLLPHHSLQHPWASPPAPQHQVQHSPPLPGSSVRVSRGTCTWWRAVWPAVWPRPSWRPLIASRSSSRLVPLLLVF